MQPIVRVPIRLAAGLGIALLSVAAAITIVCSQGLGAKLADAVTKERLLSLRPGMTEEQVVGQIGYPLHEVRHVRPVPIGQERRASWTGSSSWIYGEPGWCGGGLEIDVVMNLGRLVRVDVESYDLGVYKCDSTDCPVIWDDAALDGLDQR